MQQPANPFAALGSTGTAFGGAGSGGFSFGAPTAAFGAPAKPAEGEDGADDGEEGGAAPEEECQAEFKPVVQLEEVEAKSGEEDEEALIEL